MEEPEFVDVTDEMLDLRAAYKGLLCFVAAVAKRSPGVTLSVTKQELASVDAETVVFEDRLDSYVVRLD
jgi:hypothetical protein